MATVLVSFIGIGSRSGGEYETIQYFFDREVSYRETSIFGSALLQYLKDQNRTVDRWLILGTEKSIWSELIKMFTTISLSVDEENLREFLEEQAIYCQSSKDYKSKITQKSLDDWQGILTDNLTSIPVTCRLVGDATDVTSQNAIFQSLLEVIQRDDEIVLDVTHGLRNQPLITSFVLMYLRHLQKIEAKNIEFYYGAKDLDGKVIKLDFCNELLEATEAVAIYEQTGNYEKIGKNLKMSEDFNSKLEKLTFFDEVNKTNPEIPNQLNDEISKADFSPLQKSLADRFKNPLHWRIKKTLANQLRHKALFAFDRRQYFKAVSFLLEAVIVIYGENCGDTEISDNLELHFYRDRAEGELLRILNQSEKQVLKNLKKLRNAIIHGTDANGRELEAIKARNAINDENELKQIFRDGDVLFLKIKNGGIGK